MHVRFRLPASLLAFLFLPTGCVDVEDPIDTDPARIVNGSPIDTDEFKAIVSINNGACTGTFIHPRYVITAAHCLPTCGPGGTGCIIGPPGTSGATWSGVDGPVNLSLDDGLDGSTGTKYVADAVIFPRASDANAVPPDVAVLHVDRLYHRQVVNVAPWFQAPSAGTIGSWAGRLVQVAGYSSNNGTVARQRRVGTLKIHGNTAGDRWFPLDSQPAYSCPGDSGGPTLIRDNNNALQLIGVHSRGFCDGTTEPGSWEAYLPHMLMLERIAAAEPLCDGLLWHLCVAALPPAGEPIPPAATAAWSPGGVVLRWTDNAVPGVNRIRITRSPARPGGAVELAVQPLTNRVFVDAWSSSTVGTLNYTYTVCAISTLHEEACSTVPYQPPQAAPPTQVRASANDSLDTLFLHFATTNNGAAQADVRIYRNGVSGFRTAPLGQTIDLTDTLGVYAYTRYTYRVCTVAHTGIEACTSATTDTYGGLLQCPSGFMACDGACKRVWQCPHPQ